MSDDKREFFDKSGEYEQELNRGLRLYREDRDFFLHGRIAHLFGQLAGAPAPKRILDFGCGFGDTVRHLAERWPDAEVTGIDTSAQAVDHARQNHPSERLRFGLVQDFDARERFDLCYVNGVFHHIDPSQRMAAVEMVHRALMPDGHFAVFENNPWNPGTRLLMRRLEFDRDAIPLSPIEARRMLSEGGFMRFAPTQFLFYFPAPLAFLRFAERWLVRIPLGSQYSILATRT